MGDTSWDVMVMGAGAAGLAAAAAVARAGRSVLLVEARDRIGGRVWTRYERDLPVPLELGAEFIHGRPAATFDLLARAGQAAVDSPRNHWTRYSQDTPRPRANLFDEIQHALEPGRLGDEDLSFDAFLARARGEGMSEDTLAFARMLVEGFDAADPSRISAHSIAEEWCGDGAADAPQFRPSAGYTALLTTLVTREVRLQLQTDVRIVRWRRGAVEIEGRFLGQTFRATAPRAIVTLPLGVLQLADDAPGAVLFEPSLDGKRQALLGLASGPVIKILLRFRRAFWEDLDRGRYANVSFFHAPQAAFPTFWTALPARVPVLVAWAGGPKAARLAGVDAGEIVHRSLESLQTVFGEQLQVEPLLETAWFHDWQQDPLACGAYSYVTVGGSQARKQLARPLENTLFFAGEATDTEGEAGTVAGALQSGERAAREVLAGLD